MHSRQGVLLVFNGTMAQAYRQLPPDPGDWPLVCFNFHWAYYTDISLLFGLRWAAVHCQDVTSPITRELNTNGAAFHSYIDDLGGVATDQATTATDFNTLRAFLSSQGLHVAAHKASSPPSQVMVWLGLQFDTVAITFSLSQDKLAEIQLMIHTWSLKPTATLKDLRTLLGKLLYIFQVCPPAHLFLNIMLDTYRDRVSSLPKDKGISLHPVPDHLFTLSDNA